MTQEQIDTNINESEGYANAIRTALKDIPIEDLKACIRVLDAGNYGRVACEVRMALDHRNKGPGIDVWGEILSE
jgi:hypothetical protein